MVKPPDWPPMEPRSSTLDRIDDAIKAVEQARRGVLDEVAFLGTELDRARGQIDHWRSRAEHHSREADRWQSRALAAEAQIASVIAEAAAAVKAAKIPPR